MPRTCRQRCLFVGGVLLVIGVAYGVYSVLTWRDYITATQTVSQHVVDEVETAIGVVQSKDADLEKKRAALQRLAERMGDACVVPPGVAWQSSLFSLDSHRRSCEAAIHQRQRVAGAASGLQRYFDSEQRIRAVFIPLQRGAAATGEKEWPSIAKDWQRAKTEVAALSVDESAQSVKRATLQVVTEVEAAWQALLAAHEKKDQAAFYAAEKKLKESYGTLGDLITAAEQALRPLTGELQASRGAL